MLAVAVVGEMLAVNTRISGAAKANGLEKEKMRAAIVVTAVTFLNLSTKAVNINGEMRK